MKPTTRRFLLVNVLNYGAFMLMAFGLQLSFWRFAAFVTGLVVYVNVEMFYDRSQRR